MNEEIKRRTRVARLFPNDAACLRLVSAVLMEISEDWQTADKRYVVFNDEDAIEIRSRITEFTERKLHNLCLLVK